MDRDEARERLLEAADALYYARGIHAVGMDEVRDRAGVSLARLYKLYPSKQHLVAAYLRARDHQWRARLAAFVDQRAPATTSTSVQRLLTVFDWLAQWSAEPGYRGCAFINAWGEIGTTDDLVAAAVHEHKVLFRDYLVDLASGCDDPVTAAEQIQLLAEGAMVTSAILGGEAARDARETAQVVLAANTDVG